MASEYEIKKQILDIGRRIYNRGMVAANDGNISVKLNDHEILCTPTGISKGFMTMDMICKVDENGKVLSSHPPYRPSSEIKMHLRVYKLRPDVKSVVHAHPVHAPAFAIAGIPLTQPIMPEAVISLGCVPIAKYGTPSTDEIPDAVEPFLEHFDAVLLENHGALTFSDSLLNAYYKMEAVDFYAQLLLLSNQLGGPQEFSDEQVQRLYDIRRKLGMTGKHPANLCQNINGGCHALNHKSGVGGCGSCGGSCSTGSAKPAQVNDDMVAEITKKILAELNH